MFEPPKFKNPHEAGYEQVSDDEAKGIAAIGQAGASGRFDTTFTGNEIADLEKQIEWAPEDPNVPFQVGMVSDEKYKTWTKNYRTAISESRQTGKPLLIWFSDSKGSVISNRLSTELFSREDFDSWVRGKFVTLLVDKAHFLTLPKSKQDAAKRYDLKMRKRFGIKGSPEVLVVDFDGQVHGRYRGYTEDTDDFYWGRIKHAQKLAQKRYGSWREGMEKKGYRMWHTIDSEKKVFAKMTAKTVEKVTLVTPNGKRSTMSQTRLSQEDRAWIIRNEPIQ